VDAHRLGGDLVLADGDQRAAERGVHDAVHHQDRERREQVDPEEVRDLRDAAEAARASHGVDVQDQDANDLAEAERHDREVVAAQAQRRHADEEPRDGREERADRERDEKHGAVAREGRHHRERPADSVAEGHGEVRRGVRADRHEPGVAERELSGEPVDQVEGDGQRDVDAGEADDLEEVRGHRDARAERAGERRVRDDQHAGDRESDQEAPHTFSFWTRPRRPCGRRIRTRIRMPNAIASRYVEER
jgi:hypothetical protein